MRETVKTIKKSISPKINFSPKDNDEKEYLFKLKNLLDQKRRGDWGLVAEMLGLPKESKQSAEKAFLRVYSRDHFKAVEALEKIIQNRKALLKQ